MTASPGPEPKPWSAPAPPRSPKACAWVFCRQVFQPRSAVHKFCSGACREGSQAGGAGPGYPARMPGLHDVPCAGNCGNFISNNPRKPYCAGCFAGTRHNVRHPFGPALAAGERRCSWLFCNAVFTPPVTGDVWGPARHCYAWHWDLALLGAKGWPTSVTAPAQGRGVCRGCGSRYGQIRQDQCLNCWLGARYGRVNPFTSDKAERARWGQPARAIAPAPLSARLEQCLARAATKRRAREAEARERQLAQILRESAERTARLEREAGAEAIVMAEHRLASAHRDLAYHRAKVVELESLLARSYLAAADEPSLTGPGPLLAVRRSEPAPFWDWDGPVEPAAGPSSAPVFLAAWSESRPYGWLPLFPD